MSRGVIVRIGIIAGRSKSPIGIVLTIANKADMVGFRKGWAAQIREVTKLLNQEACGNRLPMGVAPTGSWHTAVAAVPVSRCIMQTAPAMVLRESA